MIFFAYTWEGKNISVVTGNSLFVQRVMRYRNSLRASTCTKHVVRVLKTK